MHVIERDDVRSVARSLGRALTQEGVRENHLIVLVHALHSIDDIPKKLGQTLRRPIKLPELRYLYDEGASGKEAQMAVPFGNLSFPWIIHGQQLRSLLTTTNLLSATLLSVSISSNARITSDLCLK